MEELDQSLISLFDKSAKSPEVHQTMRDFVYLAGVFSALGNAKTFDSPLEILVFLRIIQFFNMEALNLDEPIESAETIYYRYIDMYDDMEPPTKKRIEQYVNILITYNWVSKQSNRLKMRSIGKRLMDMLIRGANDALAYYMQDEIGRSLFQAKRDAEISEAYDDYGISGGNIVASMLHHLTESIELLKERELELLADKNALPQLELIDALMKELKVKLEDRLDRLSTMEDSLMMSDLMLKSTEYITEGTSLSLGMIKKYFKFKSMQAIAIGYTISPEKTRQFIENMFNPPVQSDIPNAHQILSFMEQGKYEGESTDGMWVPVKVAPFLSSQAIDEGIDFLENYEPYMKDEMEEDAPIFYQTEMVDAADIDDLYGEALWTMTKAVIHTDAMEDYLDKKKTVELEEIIVESSSNTFGDAVRSLMASSALVANKRINIEKAKVTKEYDKEWEWIKREDRKHRIQQRNRK